MTRGSDGRCPRVIVDLAALSHNLEKIRAMVPGCPVMAVVKANAYGHGLVAAARALEAADALAVARIEEALALREAGIRNEIVLLEGVAGAAEMRQAAQHRLTLVVHSAQQIGLLEDYPARERFRCWLKLDTGMHRLGFTEPECDDAISRMRQCQSVLGQPGLMTHLATAEVPDDPGTARQLEAFARLAQGWPGELSVANSAAILRWPAARTGWVRPGLALYGVSPLPGVTGEELGLQPAMQLVSRLISVKTVPRGGRVGYTGAWTAPEECRIGIAAVGYGDGYLRAFRNGTPVRIGEGTARLVGRVSMDMIALDLGECRDAGVGSEVVLWGPGLPVEQLAGWADTIPYELVCNVSARVVTEYLEAPVLLA